MKLKLSITIKLLALIALLLLLSNGLLGIRTLSISRRDLANSANKTMQDVSDSVALRIEEFVEKEFSLIEGIAGLPVFSDEDLTLEMKCAQLQHINMTRRDRYENIAFYDKDGMSYTAAGELRDFSKAEYFQGAMKGERWLRAPALNPITNSVLMFFSVPVLDENHTPCGVIVSIIKGNPILDIISKIDIGGGMHPVIINLPGASYVADANPSGEGQEGSQAVLDPNSEIMKVFDNLFSGKSGSGSFFNPMMGMKVTCNYRPINPENPFGYVIPWTVFCVAPYDVYYGQINELRLNIYVTTILFIILGIIIGAIVLRMIIKPLITVKNSIEEIASGNADLTKRIENKSRDEIGEVVAGFNKFTEKLQDIMGDLKSTKDNLITDGLDLDASTQDTTASIVQIISNINSVHGQINNQSKSVEETVGAVNEIASNIESLEKMIENQSSGIVQASAAVEEMMGNINSVNISVDKMANSFDELSNSASSGAKLQTTATEKIEQIKQQSETLQDANIAIAAIAEQTNLLAMNAAIEAAHAGEAGKGFSVVADEIRKLSETSSQQSATIGQQLNTIRESIESMVNASLESSNAFQHVTDKISETDELVRQIKAAMEEQTLGSQQIGEALQNMNDSTVEVRTASQEMSIGNKAILSEVRNLQNATLEMKNSMDEMAVGAQKINATGAALDEIASKIKDSINVIGEQVDQFKV